MLTKLLRCSLTCRDLISTSFCNFYLLVVEIKLWYCRYHRISETDRTIVPTQTPGPLNHPPRSPYESICVGQLLVWCVFERVGPLSAGPGALSTPSPFTRRPDQWTSTNGITAPLFQCTLSLCSYTGVRERERLWCQPGTARRELMGLFTSHNMSIF